MTIYRKLLNAATQRSNYQGNWLRLGKPAADPKTRQTTRAMLRDAWGLKFKGRGLSRSEARKLARAYASKSWREGRAKAAVK